MRASRLRAGVAVLLLWASSAVADYSQTFTGNNTGAPLWQRPVGAGPALSSGTVHYRFHRFTLQAASRCTFYSVQNFDGYLHLYRGGFNPGSPLTNLIDGDDDAEMGIGTSRVPSDLDVNFMTEAQMPAGAYFAVVSGFASGDVGAYQVFVQCEQPPVSTCFFTGYPREQQVCLLNRFAVIIDQVTNSTTGRATPVPLGSNDSAFFWFYSDSNYEVLIKVLDACSINGKFWVFFAGTTNQGFRVVVGDVVTQVVKQYARGEGPPAPAVTDVLAFDC